MLKLVVAAAFLAVASSAPPSPTTKFVEVPLYNRPDIPLNPFGLSGYPVLAGYAPPAPITRTALPNPYISPISYSPYNPFRSYPTQYAAAPDQPTPIYVSPETHAMYEAAIASFNPLSYVARLEATKILEAQHNQQNQQNQKENSS